MEQNNVKIFYKPVDGGELKELECVSESDGFEFEPLKEHVDVKYDPTPFTHSLSFDIDGLRSIKFEEFIKQPLEGMLYDVNRCLPVILTYIDDPKWVNDFALTKLLEYYYNKCNEQEKKLKEYEGVQ